MPDSGVGIALMSVAQKGIGCVTPLPPIDIYVDRVVSSHFSLTSTTILKFYESFPRRNMGSKTPDGHRQERNGEGFSIRQCDVIIVTLTT